MIDIFGRERAIECWCGALMNLIDRPLLHGFISGMKRVLGNDPGQVISWFPKGWSLAYRDVCTPVLQKTPSGRPTIAFSDVADEVRRYSNYFHSWHGACRGMSSIAGVDGRVHFSISSDFTFCRCDVGRRSRRRRPDDARGRTLRSETLRVALRTFIWITNLCRAHSYTHRASELSN